ncbi:MAG: hypothetical protein QN189_05455 [Armatimonadota bacterium]|nr:hypothetical protein [Armatimonadota bacterium]
MPVSGSIFHREPLNAGPRIILAPLFVIWFGIGIASKIALSFLLVTVVYILCCVLRDPGDRSRLIDRVRALGGGRVDLLREVSIPSLAAWLLGGLKGATGFAFTGAIVGEFVASSRGLGYLLSFAHSTYNAALTIALIVLVSRSCWGSLRRSNAWSGGSSGGNPHSTKRNP